MDSTTFLDYALFQLTPTRTRCDLVIYAGSAREKLASGLLQPFVQHLKTAKDQISRGGYSVTLRPQFSNASWFTKATLQRFVRFVSSPEILERFVTIEREIEQIESSVQSNADAEGNGVPKSTSSYKSSEEQNRDNDTAPEETSKVRLQRALGTRKAVLHREQAMTYARALVVGFEMDAINDLISFADAFGALRLREACINFRELCKKKDQDRLWVDEIAAVQAARLELPGLANSGIILAGEENQSGIFFNGKHNGSVDASVSDSATSHGSDVNQDGNFPADGKVQVPMPWANHLPQYMHNFQGPVFPPYQAYPFPGMQVPPPYFPGNMQWPPNMDESWRSEDHSSQRSSSRKKKSLRKKGLEHSDEDVTESSDSDTDSVSDESSRKSSKKQNYSKKHGKKSSRKVVIRNINYITSKKDGEETSDDEQDLIDGDSIKQQVEEAVSSLERRQRTGKHSSKKSHRSGKGGSSDASDQEQKNSSATNLEKENVNDQWGAFQTLLMRDTDQESLDTGSRSLQVQEEYFAANNFEGKPKTFDLESEEVRKQRVISSDSFIATNRETTNGFESNVKGFEAIGDSHSVIKRRESTYEELLFSQRNESGDVRDAVADYSSESRIIKSQSEGDWFVANKDERMDLKMFNGDYVPSGENFNGGKSKNGVFVDDSFMIQARPVIDDHTDSLLRTDIVEASRYESGTVEEVSHKPKGVGDYEPDDLYMVLGRDSAAEHAVSSWIPEISYDNDILSVEANGKHLISAEDQPPSDGNSNSKDANGKLGKKVSSRDARLKVSNGALTKSKTEIMSRTKKPSPGGRTMAHKGKSDLEEERRRRMEELLIQRQKRIAERSNGGGSPAVSRKITVEKRSGVTSTKNDKPKTVSTHQGPKKTVFRTSTIDRLATARTTAKEPPAQSKSAQTKKPASKANGPSQKIASTDKRTGLKTVKTDENKQTGNMKTISKEQVDVSATEVTKPRDTAADDFKDIKELHSVESLEKTEVKKTQNLDALDEKSCNNGSVQIDSSTHIEISNGNYQDLTKTSDHPVKDISVNMTHPRPESPPKASTFVNQYVEADGKTHQNFKSQEISEIEISTPPADETNPELIHARKKWNTDESSPKATKGFRKLLLFGRKG